MVFSLVLNLQWQRPENKSRTDMEKDLVSDWLGGVGSHRVEYTLGVCSLLGLCCPSGQNS